MGKRVIIVDDSRAVIATAELALEGLIDSGVIEFKSYLNPLELLGHYKAVLRILISSSVMSTCRR